MDPTYKLTDWILCDFRHDTDLQFSRLNMELLYISRKMVRLPQNEKQTYNIDWTQWPSSLTLAMTLKGEV